MTTDKPSQNENEYFARLDAELLERQQRDQRLAEESAERKTHLLRCPRCGGHLMTKTVQEVQIDQCPDCSGIWLDPGELNALASRKDPNPFAKMLSDIFSGFRKK